MTRWHRPLESKKGSFVMNDGFVNQGVVQNDTWIFRHTFCKNGGPWDLTAANVSLFLEDPNGNVLGPFAATIDDAINGKASYTVDSTVLSIPGDWLKEWLVDQLNITWRTASETFTVLPHL
jgi:BppU N-terminal domain